MDRPTMFELALSLGANESLAAKAIAFVEWGWAVVTPERPMASPAWFEWAKPLVETNPAAAAIGLSILGKQDTIEPIMTLKLIGMSYEAGKSAATRHAQTEKEAKKMLEVIEDWQKKLVDMLEKSLAETNCPELAEVIQAFVKSTVDKKKDDRKKEDRRERLENRNKKKQLKRIEDAEKVVQEVLTRGLTISPQVGDFLQAVARRTLAKSEAFKSELKGSLTK
jgi:hypothetical protein